MAKGPIKIADMRILKQKKDSVIPAEFLQQNLMSIKHEYEPGSPSPMKKIKELFGAVMAGDYNRLKNMLHSSNSKYFLVEIICL